jgi:HJR/Mrr/RecB family endonuclease
MRRFGLLQQMVRVVSTGLSKGMLVNNSEARKHEFSLLAGRIFNQTTEYVSHNSK